MKTILFILLLCTPALSDVYVVTAPDQSVYSLSEQNDAVIPPGYKQDIVKGKSIQDLAIDDVTVYKFSGNKFTVDGKKLADKRKQESDMAIEVENRKSVRKSAIDKLKVLGLTEDEISVLIGG